MGGTFPGTVGWRILGEQDSCTARLPPHPTHATIRHTLLHFCCCPFLLTSQDKVQFPWFATLLFPTCAFCTPPYRSALWDLSFSALSSPKPLLEGFPPPLPIPPPCLLHTIPLTLLDSGLDGRMDGCEQGRTNTHHSACHLPPLVHICNKPLRGSTWRLKSKYARRCFLILDYLPHACFLYSCI